MKWIKYNASNVHTLKSHLCFFSRHQTGFNMRSVLTAVLQNKLHQAYLVEQVVALMHCDL